MTQTTTQTQLEKISNSIRQSIAKSARNEKKKVPPFHSLSVDMKEMVKAQSDSEINKHIAGVYANALFALRIV
jgi:hypothetical protein